MPPSYTILYDRCFVWLACIISANMHQDFHALVRGMISLKTCPQHSMWSILESAFHSTQPSACSSTGARRVLLRKGFESWKKDSRGLASAASPTPPRAAVTEGVHHCITVLQLLCDCTGQPMRVWGTLAVLLGHVAVNRGNRKIRSAHLLSEPINLLSVVALEQAMMAKADQHESHPCCFLTLFRVPGRRSQLG